MGATARLLLGRRTLLQLRASGTEQRHEHRFSASPESDVRQTRFDPLVRPTRGAGGGRWMTDAWTELAGRTFNGGVRWAF